MNHRTRRLLTVALAPVAALAAWAVFRLVGIDLVVAAGDGTVGAVDVVASASVGALSGWVAVRLLEARSRHPRAWWYVVGTTALSVSVTGPSYLADGASAAALITLHFVVAVVVITGLASTLQMLPVERDILPVSGSANGGGAR